MARVPRTTEDARMLRRLAPAELPLDDVPVRQPRDPWPQCYQWFLRHFPGRRGFFTELAVFRSEHAQPAITDAVLRQLRRLTDAVALMRIAHIRPSRQCGFCAQVDAPFCATVGAVQPAGAKQGPNTKSTKCVLERALNCSKPAPERILVVFAAMESQQLRRAQDTNDQGRRMHFLAAYVSEVWSATHRYGVVRVLRAIYIALQAHGIAPSQCVVPPPPNDQRRKDELRADANLLAASATGAGELEMDAAMAAQFAMLHMHMCGADFADLAMHVASLALANLSPLDPPGLNRRRIPPAPRGWLADVAVSIHAAYRPETYIAKDGKLHAVSRDNQYASRALRLWIERFHRFPSMRFGDERRDEGPEEEHEDEHEEEFEEEQDDEIRMIARIAQARRIQLVEEEEEEEEEGMEVAAHGAPSLDEEEEAAQRFDGYEEDEIPQCIDDYEEEECAHIFNNDYEEEEAVQSFDDYEETGWEGVRMYGLTHDEPVVRAAKKPRAARWRRVAWMLGMMMVVAVLAYASYRLSESMHVFLLRQAARKTLL